VSYSRHWDCWVCAESQESIDTPKVEVCERCLEPVANKLCQDRLSTDIWQDGVDKAYWMRLADDMIAPMWRRRKAVVA
jgi:hypothetical protein